MIAVICPVLGRPQNAQPLADSLAANTTVPHRLLFVVSPDDAPSYHACHQTGADLLLATWAAGHGDFARKIAAGYERSDEPWIFQAADDVRFTPGWDEALLACADRTGALVIGTDDCHNPTVRAGRHSTHTLIARSYCDDPGASADGPGTVFSTAYAHQWCDNELVQLAMARGVWAFCADSRVIHDHPFWTGGRRTMDATYRKGLGSAVEDRRMFERRSRAWRGRV